jgi:very-short-patch-repair endonuclease
MDAREKKTQWLLLMDNQEGVVGRAEAKDIGVSPQAIGRRMRRGRWQRIQRGVYGTFTGSPSRNARLWAAVRRAGPGAMLSHETAGELHDLVGKHASTIHVTVPHRRRPAQQKPIRGVTIHRSRHSGVAQRLPDWHVPRTSVEDTVLDLVASLRSLDDAYSVVSRALLGGKTTEAELLESLAARRRYVRRTWLRDAIADAGNGIHFPLERLYVRDVERAHGLPKAVRQAIGMLPSGRHYKDSLYVKYKVCVELDGAAYHSAEQVVADKRRDNLNLAADDIRTFRFAYVDVTARACECAEMVAAALRRGGWTGGPCACKRDGCQVGRPVGLTQRDWG